MTARPLPVIDTNSDIPENIAENLRKTSSIEQALEEVVVYTKALEAAVALSEKIMPASRKTIFLGINDLMARWQCKYAFANAFMHRKGSGAIKVGKKLLVDEKEVIAYEKLLKVRAR